MISWSALNIKELYLILSLVKGVDLIAQDKYIVQEMLMFLEYSFTPGLPASTRFMQRALLITLGRLAKKSMWGLYGSDIQYL